jgi:hypothetical protein
MAPGRLEGDGRWHWRLGFERGLVHLDPRQADVGVERWRLRRSQQGWQQLQRDQRRDGD